MTSTPVHLVFGATGQVGFDLVRELQSHGRVVGLSRPELDLERADTIRAAIRTHRPTIIWNAAAATAVDALEDDPDLAFRVNATAPGVMAEEARRVGAFLVHFSTDYVFDGTKREPYVEDDEPNPLNVYGRSKLAGEQAVQEVGKDHLIFRTGWIYSSRGRNFFRTMVSRGAGVEAIHVVSDQVGVPTWSRELAQTCAAVVNGPMGRSGGLFHLTAHGSCSWFDFACSIRDEILSLGGQWQALLLPVTTQEYGSRTLRPGYSVLSNDRFARAYGVSPGDWRASLRTVSLELDTDQTDRNDE